MNNGLRCLIFFKQTKLLVTISYCVHVKYTCTICEYSRIIYQAWIQATCKQYRWRLLQDHTSIAHSVRKFLSDFWRLQTPGEIIGMWVPSSAPMIDGIPPTSKNWDLHNSRPGVFGMRINRSRSWAMDLNTLVIMRETVDWCTHDKSASLTCKFPHA